jgi:hypothetical protein
LRTRAHLITVLAIRIADPASIANHCQPGIWCLVAFDRINASCGPERQIAVMPEALRQKPRNLKLRFRHKNNLKISLYFFELVTYYSIMTNTQLTIARLEYVGNMIAKYSHRWGENPSRRLQGWVDEYNDIRANNRQAFTAWCAEHGYADHNGYDRLA